MYIRTTNRALKVWYAWLMRNHTADRASKRVRRLREEGHEVEFKHDWRYLLWYTLRNAYRASTTIRPDRQRACCYQARPIGAQSACAQNQARCRAARKVDIEVAQERK